MAATTVTMQQLIEAGAHFGHQTYLSSVQNTLILIVFVLSQEILFDSCKLIVTPSRFGTSISLIFTF